MVGIYCLSHKNDQRRDRIRRMFASQTLEPAFYDGVDAQDPRIMGRELDANTERCWSIMYGHLDMLRLFLDSDNCHAVFCEDDILIRKDFGHNLKNIVRDFVELRLDVLLLGCLCSNRDFRLFSNFPRRHTVHSSAFEYYAYDSNPESAVWGTQMYMLNRAQAKYLLDKYSRGYADESRKNSSLVPFSADWTITKDGEKALVYPLVAIEDCSVDYEDAGQDHCRKKCYGIFYSDELFWYD